MIEEPFAFGKSFVHRLDPRVRVFFAVLYSFVIALCSNFDVLLIALSISLFLVLLARLRFREVLKRLKPLCVFLALLFIVLPITYEGKPFYQTDWLAFSEPGVHLSLRILLKSLSILLVFMALVATMTISTLGRSLRRLGFPEKLVQLLLMTYRYIYVIEHEYKRLWTAVKVRGFQGGTNMHTYKTYAYLIGMLFVRASARAERVYQAMVCRGFKGRFYSLDEFQPFGGNFLFSILMIAVILAIIILEKNALWIMLHR